MTTQLKEILHTDTYRCRSNPKICRQGHIILHITSLAVDHRNPVITLHLFHLLVNPFKLHPLHQQWLCKKSFINAVSPLRIHLNQIPQQMRIHTPIDGYPTFVIWIECHELHTW
jgi:hypothetical protein